MRKLLFPFSFIFDFLTRVRNYLYNKKVLKPFQFDVLTIGVGNLSVGGTGKSPHVEYLIELLKNDFFVATLSRGYGRKSKGFLMLNNERRVAEVGDEPFMFKRKYPNIPVAVSENRVLGVVELLSLEAETNLIILDDVFQHRAIHPHIQILLTPFDEPFFQDYLLPAGNLRESRAGASRADIIVVTKCNQNITKDQRKAFENKLKFYNKSAFICFSYFEYGAIKSVFKEETFYKTPETMLAFAGIAKPDSFFLYLESIGNINKHLFKDHQNYTLSDLENLKSISDSSKWICTEKDVVKLLSFQSWFEINGISLFYLPIKVKFLENGFDDFILKKTLEFQNLLTD